MTRAFPRGDTISYRMHDASLLYALRRPLLAPGYSRDSERERLVLTDLSLFGPPACLDALMRRTLGVPRSGSGRCVRAALSGRQRPQGSRPRRLRSARGHVDADGRTRLLDMPASAHRRAALSAARARGSRRTSTPRAAVAAGWRSASGRRRSTLGRSCVQGSARCGGDPRVAPTAPRSARRRPRGVAAARPG